MNKWLLASFCNIPSATSSPLVLISLPINKNSKTIPVSLGNVGLVSTATGLAKGDKKIFVSFISEGKFKLSVLDEKSLFPLYQINFPASQDVHSMLYDGGYLYTVSTGTDEVIRYKIKKDKLGEPELVWKAGEDRKENHHINSIYKFKGEIIISGFGKSKMDNVWRTAYDGIIFNVTKGIILKDALYHPHSVSSNGDELFYCESGYGKFSSTSKTIKVLNGYTRGVQFDGDNFYVATSVGRSNKKSSSIIHNPADYGKKMGNCKIQYLTSKGKVVDQLEFSWFANEIYDLLLLDEVKNADKLFLSSFIQERKTLSEVVSEQNRFWNFIKRKTK